MAAAAAASSARAAVPRMIMPRWWTGSPAIPTDRYTIDARPYAPALQASEGKEMPTELKERMKETFDREGVVLVRGTGLRELTQMGRLVREVQGDGMKYEAGANPRSAIAENVFDVGAPESAHLHYHHEMAYTGDSVKSLGFCVQSSIAGGDGATFLSHNAPVTDDILRTEVGRKLRDRGVTYIRCLTDREATLLDTGVYNHWQKSFGTDDPEEAQAMAQGKGLHVEWGPGRYMRTAYTVSAFEYHEASDRNHLFSSVADDGVWFDTWPGVAELPGLASFASATPAQRPLKMVYGDGSPISEDELRDFCHAYDAHGFPLRWEAQDVAVFCNFRFAHGRPSFAAPAGQRRSIGVLLGPTFRRHGHRDDKW